MKYGNLERGAIATATVKDLIVNYPNKGELDPNRDATRAEVAAMVYQALVNSGILTALNSDYIVSACRFLAIYLP